MSTANPLATGSVDFWHPTPPSGPPPVAPGPERSRARRRAHHAAGRSWVTVALVIAVLLSGIALAAYATRSQPRKKAAPARVDVTFAVTSATATCARVDPVVGDEPIAGEGTLSLAPPLPTVSVPWRERRRVRDIGEYSLYVESCNGPYDGLFRCSIRVDGSLIASDTGSGGCFAHGYG